jgi:hypothetical protein
MPQAILPVKRPETDPGPISRSERVAYKRINVKSLPPDLKWKQEI